MLATVVSTADFSVPSGDSSTTLLSFLCGWDCLNDVGAAVGLSDSALMADMLVVVVEELNARSSSRENGFRGEMNNAGELKK